MVITKAPLPPLTLSWNHEWTTSEFRPNMKIMTNLKETENKEKKEGLILKYKVD